MSAIRHLLTPVFAATLALAAACSEQKPQASNFTPVPVTPVLGDVPEGDPNAPVTVVEYAALTCHVCRDFAKQIYPRLKSTYIDTGKVKYIYRDFPLEYDPATGKASDGFGVLLSSVARCKGADKFHEAVDAMFTAQADLLDAAQRGEAGPVIARVADGLGLTREETRTCIDFHPELNASIKASRDEGAAKGVKGTPSIFINDEMLSAGASWENLSAAIEAKLSGAPAAPAAPASAPVAPASAPGATPPASPPT